MRENSSDVLEVRLAGGRLQVLRNQKVLPFSENKWMDLRGQDFRFLLCFRHGSLCSHDALQIDLPLI